MTKEVPLPTREHIEELGWDKVEPPKESVGQVREFLGERIIGQDEALDSLGRSIVRCEAGYRDPERPTGVFMFLGPTGVGKTESAKALTEYLTGDQDDLIRVNCGQLTEKHSTYRFTGAPPSYVGYGNPTLIDPKELRKPNVILLDEIEKAHPAVHRMLLSVFDNGSLTVSYSETGSWRSGKQEQLNFALSYIVMTSNVGAEKMSDIATESGLGFKPNSGEQSLAKAGKGALRKEFRHMPEFLNRIDETVVFDYLGKDELMQIGNKFIKEYCYNKRHDTPLIWMSKEAMGHLVDESLERKEYGARELKRLIDREVITKASEVVFGSEFDNDWMVLIADHEDDEWVFYGGGERPQESERRQVKTEIKQHKKREKKEIEVTKETSEDDRFEAILENGLRDWGYYSEEGQYKIVYRLRGSQYTERTTCRMSASQAEEFLTMIPKLQKQEELFRKIFSAKKRRIE